MSQWEEIEELNHNEELRDSIIDEGLLNSLPLCKHVHSSFPQQQQPQYQSLTNRALLNVQSPGHSSSSLLKSLFHVDYPLQVFMSFLHFHEILAVFDLFLFYDQQSHNHLHLHHDDRSHDDFLSLHRQQFAQILFKNLLDHPISNEDNHFLLSVLSRKHTLQRLFPRQFQTISRLPSQHDQDIKEDVERTFRDSLAFNTPQTLAELKTILKCISHSLPEIGYVQGWNQLAGVLLRCQFTCEDTYWLMMYLLKKLNAKELFMGDFRLAKTLDKEFEMTVSSILPEVLTVLNRFEMELSYFSTFWFITMFTFDLNPQAAVRLWILIALKGWKYLIYFSLAVLSLLQGRLLHCEDEEQIDYLLKKTLRANILGQEDKLFRDASVFAGQLSQSSQLSAAAGVAASIPIVGLDDYQVVNKKKKAPRSNNNISSQQQQQQQQLPASNQYYFHYHNSSMDYHLHHSITTNSIGSLNNFRQQHSSIQDKQHVTFDSTQPQKVVVAKELKEDLPATKGREQSDGRVYPTGKIHQILLPQECVASDKAHLNGNSITTTGNSYGNNNTNIPTAVIPVSSIFLHTAAPATDMPSSPIPQQLISTPSGSLACKMNTDSPQSAHSQSRPSYSASSATTTDNNNYSQKLHTPLNYPSVSLVTPFLSKPITRQQGTPLRSTQTTNNHNNNNNSRILKSKQSANSSVLPSKISTQRNNSKNNHNATAIPLSAGGQQQMNVSISTGSAKVTNTTTSTTTSQADQNPQEHYPSLNPQHSSKNHFPQPPQFRSLDGLLHLSSTDDKQSPPFVLQSTSHNRNNTTVSVSISTAGITNNSSKQSSCGNEDMLQQKLQQSVNSGDARSGCENRRDWAARQEVWNLGRKQDVPQEQSYNNSNNNNIFFTKLLSIFSPNEELSKSIHAFKTEPDRLLQPSQQQQSFQPPRLGHYNHSISNSSNELLLSSKQLHTPSRILQTTSSQGDIDQIPNYHNINRSEGEYNHHDDIDEEVSPSELTLSRKYSQQSQALTCKFEVRVASKKKKNNHIQSDYSLGSMMQQSGQQIYQSSSSKSLSYLPATAANGGGIALPKESNAGITTTAKNNPKKPIPPGATTSITLVNPTKERLTDNSLTTSLNWGVSSQNHGKIYTERETAFQKPTVEITRVKTTSSPIKGLAMHRALSGTANMLIGLDNAKRNNQQQSQKQYFSANKQKAQQQQVIVLSQEQNTIRQQTKQGQALQEDQSQFQLSSSVVQMHKNSISFPNNYYQPIYHGSSSSATGIKTISVSQQFQENSLVESQQQQFSSQGHSNNLPMKITPGSSSLSMSQEFQQQSQFMPVQSQQQQQQQQQQQHESLNTVKQGLIIEESMATTMTTTTDYNTTNQHNITQFINDTVKIDKDNNLTSSTSNTGMRSLHLGQLRKQIAQQTYNANNNSSNNSSTCNLTNLSSSTQEMQQSQQQSQSLSQSKSQFKRSITKNYQNYHSYTEGTKKKQLGITGSTHATTASIALPSPAALTTATPQPSWITSTNTPHTIYAPIPALDLVKSQQWTSTDKHEQLIQSIQLTDSPSQSNQDALLSSQQSLSSFKPSLKCRRISEQMNPQYSLLQSQQLTKRSTLGDIMHHQHHYTNTTTFNAQDKNNSLLIKNLAGGDKEQMLVSECFKQQQQGYSLNDQQSNNNNNNKQLNVYYQHRKNSSIAVNSSQREASVSKRQAMNELIKSQKESQQQSNLEQQSKPRPTEDTPQFKLLQSQQLLKPSSQYSYQQWKQYDGSRKGSQTIKMPARMSTEPTSETTAFAEIPSKEKQRQSNQLQHQQQQHQPKESLNQISPGKPILSSTYTPHSLVQHRS